ncbi:hypothetical protein [Wolbachia endosymbiont of Ctenocephalides felis wCfeJ]|uniref:hypothetical protein n=1 Tax=Wolbachia endosymbiont of Ctenocephalides felis wCfeJ TaxID=2732594 RepID=UPI001444C505|nr:hypothetical protein [Wolbachia endosymbiont of Ctenocephalides felis wCfeJ]WCR57551.1 MAG: hypothetical protein PG980_000023 [Wolbachia endosymbiont of Ctenocephalides felis wCfeJ]
MGYTRKQLNEAIQARNDQLKKRFKSRPVTAILVQAAGLGITIGITAGIGVIVGLALSYISLSPIIVGGIIGLSVPLISLIINACSDFKTSEEAIEHKRILRE